MFLIQFSEFLSFMTESAPQVTYIIISFYVILIIVPVIAEFRIFKKMGLKGYKSLIPFYCYFILFKRMGYSPLFPILYTISCTYFFVIDPLINDILLSTVGGLLYFVIPFIIHIKKSIALSAYFGKNSMFTLGLVLFYPAFIMILAFGKSRFLKDDLPCSE